MGQDRRSAKKKKKEMERGAEATRPTSVSRGLYMENALLQIRDANCPQEKQI